MKRICYCFMMHIPNRLRRYRFFEIGSNHYYYDDMQTEEQVTRMVQQSYLPLGQTLTDMIRLSKGKFHCAIAISGTTLDLMEQYAPEMIDVLKQLADTNCVEFVAMPYSYSIASEYNASEFTEQLKQQKEKINELFSQSSTTLWNTELFYSDDISLLAWKLGYKTIMTEGAKHILSWKSPNYLYLSAVQPKQRVLLRNMTLSDNLTFHFSDSRWPDYPMDAEKYIHALTQLPDTEELINIWMGAETFGIWQHAETGIFEFLKALPYYALEQGMTFVTPSEAAKQLTGGERVSVPETISWAGESKDLSVFTGNDLQQEALQKLYAVVERVHLCKDRRIKENWLLLQDINHMHYMNHIDQGSTSYESAYDAFINYMNILADFLQLVNEQYPDTIENEELNSLLKTSNNQEKEIVSLKQEIDKRRKKKK